MKSLRIRTAPGQLADHLKEEIRAGRWTERMPGESWLLVRLHGQKCSYYHRMHGVHGMKKGLGVPVKRVSYPIRAFRGSNFFTTESTEYTE